MIFDYDTAMKPGTPEVRIKWIDFGLNPTDLNRALATEDDPTRTADAVVATWKEEVAPRPTICFTSSLRAAQALSIAFSAVGVPADWTGVASRGCRGKFRMLADGRIRVLCVPASMAPAMDEPVVAGVVICAATKSRDLYGHMVGACAVPQAGKKNAIVVDLGSYREASVV